MPDLVDHIEVQSGTMYMQRPGYYFGYGLEAMPEVLETIVGHRLTAELGVFAVNKQLCVQEIDQVPDVPAEAFGGKSPQQILRETWEKHTDVPFSSYVLKDSDNRSDVVRGTLYEIDMRDAHRLNEWDLATPPLHEGQDIRYLGWRYWDHLVKLADGRQVSTLTTYPEQSVDRVVDGTNYHPFLNDAQVTLDVLTEFSQGQSE